MKTQSYILDEVSKSIRLKEPFSEDLIKIKTYYGWGELLDIILTRSQQLELAGNRITFKIADKKIKEAIEKFNKES